MAAVTAMLQDGRILLRDGKIAVSPDCCRKCDCSYVLYEVVVAKPNCYDDDCTILYDCSYGGYEVSFYDPGSGPGSSPTLVATLYTVPVENPDNPVEGRLAYSSSCRRECAGSGLPKPDIPDPVMDQAQLDLLRQDFYIGEYALEVFDNVGFMCGDSPVVGKRATFTMYPRMYELDVVFRLYMPCDLDESHGLFPSEVTLVEETQGYRIPLVKVTETPGYECEYGADARYAVCANRFDDFGWHVEWTNPDGSTGGAPVDISTSEPSTECGWAYIYGSGYLADHVVTVLVYNECERQDECELLFNPGSGHVLCDSGERYIGPGEHETYSCPGGGSYEYTSIVYYSMIDTTQSAFVPTKSMFSLRSATDYPLEGASIVSVTNDAECNIVHVVIRVPKQEKLYIFTVAGECCRPFSCNSVVVWMENEESSGYDRWYETEIPVYEIGSDDPRWIPVEDWPADLTEIKCRDDPSRTPIVGEPMEFYGIIPVCDGRDMWTPRGVNPPDGCEEYGCGKDFCGNDGLNTMTVGGETIYYTTFIPDSDSCFKEECILFRAIGCWTSGKDGEKILEVVSKPGALEFDGHEAVDVQFSYCRDSDPEYGVAVRFYSCCFPDCVKLNSQAIRVPRREDGCLVIFDQTEACQPSGMCRVVDVDMPVEIRYYLSLRSGSSSLNSFISRIVLYYPGGFATVRTSLDRSGTDGNYTYSFPGGYHSVHVLASTLLGALGTGACPTFFSGIPVGMDVYYTDGQSDGVGKVAGRNEDGNAVHYDSFFDFSSSIQDPEVVVDVHGLLGGFDKHVVLNVILELPDRDPIILQVNAANPAAVQKFNGMSLDDLRRNLSIRVNVPNGADMHLDGETTFSLYPPRIIWTYTVKREENSLLLDCRINLKGDYKEFIDSCGSKTGLTEITADRISGFNSNLGDVGGFRFEKWTGAERLDPDVFHLDKYGFPDIMGTRMWYGADGLTLTSVWKMYCHFRIDWRCCPPPIHGDFKPPKSLLLRVGDLGVVTLVLVMAPCPYYEGEGYVSKPDVLYDADDNPIKIKCMVCDPSSADGRCDKPKHICILEEIDETNGLFVFPTGKKSGRLQGRTELYYILSAHWALKGLTRHIGRQHEMSLPYPGMVSTCAECAGGQCERTSGQVNYDSQWGTPNPAMSHLSPHVMDWSNVGQKEPWGDMRLQAYVTNEEDPPKEVLVGVNPENHGSYNMCRAAYPTMHFDPNPPEPAKKDFVYYTPGYDDLCGVNKRLRSVAYPNTSPVAMLEPKLCQVEQSGYRVNPFTNEKERYGVASTMPSGDGFVPVSFTEWASSKEVPEYDDQGRYIGDKSVPDEMEGSEDIGSYGQDCEPWPRCGGGCTPALFHWPIVENDCGGTVRMWLWLFNYYRTFFWVIRINDTPQGDTRSISAQADTTQLYDPGLSAPEACGYTFAGWTMATPDEILLRIHGISRQDAARYREEFKAVDDEYTRLYSELQECRISHCGREAELEREIADLAPVFNDLKNKVFTMDAVEYFYYYGEVDPDGGEQAVPEPPDKMPHGCVAFVGKWTKDVYPISYSYAFAANEDDDPSNDIEPPSGFSAFFRERISDASKYPTSFTVEDIGKPATQWPITGANNV